MKKFDFVIGNPPYQQETEKESTVNGQKRRKSIFQFFQIEADKISKQASVLIYPGGRWIQQSGKGLAIFGKKQINDVSLKKVLFYTNASEVFNGSGISDGISVVIKEHNKKDHGFEYVFCENGTEFSVKLDNPGDELIPLDPRDREIIKKIDWFVTKYDLKYLHDSVLPQKLFGIESDFVSKHRDCVRQFESNSSFDKKTEIKLFANDKAGPAGRSKWFIIKRSLIQQGQEYIDKWQVTVSSAHPGGQEGRDNQLEIADNFSAFGRSRVALKSFDTYDEAVNFSKYIESIFVRYAFLVTDEALTTLALKVPDLISYRNNQIISFEEDIDTQLFSLLELTTDEISYVKERVKSSHNHKKEMH